jgi:hypothetical protein
MEAHQTDGWRLRGARIELKLDAGGYLLALGLNQTNYDSLRPG